MAIQNFRLCNYLHSFQQLQPKFIFPAPAFSQFRRCFSIKNGMSSYTSTNKIDFPYLILMGGDFINLSNRKKLDKLAEHAWEGYSRNNISRNEIVQLAKSQILTSIKAKISREQYWMREKNGRELLPDEETAIGLSEETAAELVLAEEQYQISHSISYERALENLREIKASKTLTYWADFHRVRAPYQQGSVRAIHEDKDVALDLLFELEDQNLVKLGDKVNILAPGCDNSETAVKLAVYLQEAKGIEVHIQLFDISYHALAVSRGLVILTNKQLKKHGKKELMVDILVKNALSNTSQDTLERQKLTIGCAHRLPAANSVKTIQNLLRKTLMRENDISLVSTLANTFTTRTTFINHRKFVETGLDTTANMQIPILKAGNDTIPVWDKPLWSKFVELNRGRVLKSRIVGSTDDQDNSVDFLASVIVPENKSS
jgi:hypothetical protein